MLQIPQELADSIIDRLGDDRDSFKCLGLVNRTWYPHTRSYLFESVAITSPGECKDLLGLLNQNAELCRHVRKFTLQIIGNEWATAYRSDNSLGRYFSELSERLNFVTHISVKGKGNSNWEEVLSLGGGLGGALSVLTGQPTITSILLESVGNLDVAAFSKLPNLRHLVLHRLDDCSQWSGHNLLPESLLQASVPAEGDRLFCLDITASGHALYQILESLKESPDARRFLFPKELRVSAIPWNRSMMSCVWTDFLAAGGGREVETLRIYSTIFGNEAEVLTAEHFILNSESYDLQHYPSLKTLHLIHDHTRFTEFTQALEALGSTEGRAPLETLRIDFFPLGSTNPGRDSNRGDTTKSYFNELEWATKYLSAHSVWPKLARILTRPAFAALERVVVGFDFTKAEIPEEDWNRVVRGITGGMGKMEEKIEVVKRYDMIWLKRSF